MGMNRLTQRYLALCLASFFYIIFADGSLAGNDHAAFVEYQSGPDSVVSYLVLPQGKGTFPAVILIHEWWGLNDWIMQIADSFATKGYVALAVDLYRGRRASSPEEAHELMRGVPEDRVIRDLKAAEAYLGSRSEIRGTKIGVIGWCMGGGYALSAAMNIQGLAATVVCYGRLATDTTEIQKIAAPVLGIFGKEDRGISPQSVRSFEKTAKGLGKNVEMVIYDYSGHAFMNPNNATGYRRAAAINAWDRIFRFLDTWLKPGSRGPRKN